jgi:hypothetical protein
MAERRMFAKTIIDSDAFLEMPQSTQLLYFHLSMRADDDGFINNPKSIMRNVGCKEDDIRILSGKKFIIPFESGIVVIKHWKIHNYIQKDRYHETKYKEEKATLNTDENGAYTRCIQDVSKMDTQVRLELGKDSIDKVSKEEEPDKPAKRASFQKPSLDDVKAYCLERNNKVDPAKFLAYYDSNGWKVGRNPMKDWRAAVRTWEGNGYDQKPGYSKPLPVQTRTTFLDMED